MTNFTFIPFTIKSITRLFTAVIKKWEVPRLTTGLYWPMAVFYNLFAAAEPSANVSVAHGTLCNNPGVYLSFCNKPDE